MKTPHIIIVIVMAFAFTVTSCTKKEHKKVVSSRQDFKEAEHNLGGVRVNPDKITSKGVIQAFRTVPVYAAAEGVITSFDLINGQQVTKGSVLGRVDDRNIRMEIKHLEAQVEYCDMKLRETLIGLGYKHDGLDRVPEELLEKVKASSGYTEKHVSLQNMKSHLNDYLITAPISGKVVELKVDRYSYATTDEPLFYVIDTSRFLVKFSVLENYLSFFNVGDTVQVNTVAYQDEPNNAVIRSIAPLVQSNGMIEIEAVLENNKHLAPGMSALIDIIQ